MVFTHNKLCDHNVLVNVFSCMHTIFSVHAWFFVVSFSEALKSD